MASRNALRRGARHTRISCPSAMILGFIHKFDVARKVLRFNLYPDGTRGLLDLTVDHDLIR
jgi:hypothetical protein